MGRGLHKHAFLPIRFPPYAGHLMIRFALGELHEQRREPEEAHGAFSRASRIVETLAGEIEDGALKEGFLSAPQPRRVLEHG